MSDESASINNSTQNDSKDETFIPDRSFDSDDSRQATSSRHSDSNQVENTVENTVQNQSTLLGLQNPDTGRNTLHLPIQRRRLGVPAELSSNIVKEDISFDSSTQSYSFVPNLDQTYTELVDINVITSLEAAFRILPKFDKQDSEGIHHFIKSSELAFSCISKTVFTGKKILYWVILLSNNTHYFKKCKFF
ncbi:unnamed protein product [Macrosiphum euphorbiae]|uniref:Uncharacterized protein n=1 Tax=Macrosiphum euphorbiae TaxID=13131 RepID=A0AAV0W3H8_9HEMI|nr:unnamed protein product [Macrosiphum euphorbiae]